MRKLTYIYTIVLMILLSYQMFATDWYVQPATGEYGAENGTDWANAFDGFADIAWGSISAGDNIYLSGGVDSAVYAESMVIGASGSWQNYINILPGKYSPSPSGHSGKVIIDHNYTGGAYGIQIHTSRHWIKIKGLIIRHTGDCGISIKSTTEGGATNNPSHIWIDSCEIYEVNANECIEIQGYGDAWNAAELSLTDTTRYVHHIEISNCNMWTHTDRLMDECNIIYGHLTGWLNIHHNILWQKNIQTGDGGANHIDPIQLSYSNHSVRIYNNLMSTDSCVTGHTMILGLMSRGSNYADTSIVYNNYLYNGGEYDCATNWKQEILWREPEPGDNPGGVQYLPLVYSINNTIVARNGLTWNSCAEGRYNPKESNNMFVHLGQNGAEPNMDGNSNWYSTYSTGELKYVDSMHTNLLWQSWTPHASLGGNRWRWGSTTGAIYDWADWVSAGGDGVNDDPEFVNNTRLLTDNPFEISATSPAIDAGTDMTYVLQAFEYLPMFDASTDILGNERDATWDIGAFEYTTGGWTPPDTTGIVSFTSVTNANLNSYHIAYGVVSGIDSTSHVYTATSDSFAVGYPFTLDLTIQEIENGDTIAVSNIASGSYLTANVSTVIVSGTNRTFTVTTKDIDSLPNAFTFTDINNADLSTAYTSNGVTLAGFDSAYAYAGGNVYTVNGGGDLTGYTRVFPNDVLRLKVTSSASYSTAVNSTLTVGTRSDTYRVTTKANPAVRSRVIIIGANGKAIRFSDGMFMVSE